MPSNARKPYILFEIGAHAGNDELIGDCRVNGTHLYMFEPNPTRFAELKRKTEGLENVRVFPLAVSNYNGRATFKIANFDDCSSLQDFDEKANETWVNRWHPYKHFEMVEQVDVEVIRLDAFIEQQGIDEVDCIEVDTQGEDLRVVESLGEKIAKVKKIQIEVNVHHSPLYKNGFSKQQAIGYFKKFGFEKHVSWRQCVDREENIVFRNSRYYPNRCANFVTGKSEEFQRRFSYWMVKVRRVIHVLSSKIIGKEA